MIKDIIDEYARYRSIGEKAMRQVTDNDLNIVIGKDNNSIAIIVRHLGGNLVSRFTDFQSSDGEKPWRDRDSEFEDARYDPREVERQWVSIPKGESREYNRNPTKEKKPS